MKKGFLFFAALICTISLNAQIIHTKLSPVVTVSTWDAYNVHFMNNTQANALTIWNHPWNPNLVVIRSQATMEVLFDANGLPAHLIGNEVIDAAGSWKAVNYDTLNFGGNYGNWLNDADGYLGVRFKNNNKWYYGWVKMFVEAVPTGFMVEEFAYNSTADKSLLAGQTSTLAINIQTLSDTRMFIANHQLRINNTNAAEAALLDLNGKIMALTKINSKAAIIDMTQLPAGMYVVQLTGKNGIENYKVVLP